MGKDGNQIGSALQKQIEKILATSDEYRPEDLRQAAGMLVALADLQEQTSGKSSETSSADYGRYAASYIRTHFQQRIRIADLAEMIGVSRGYLTQMIHQEVGMPPQEYLISVRMEHARLYLSTSDRPIREVAQLCGYDDPLAFSKAFKQKCKVSPSEYRILHSKQD